MKRNIISIVTLIAILTVVLCGAAFAERAAGSLEAGTADAACSPARSCVRTAGASSGARSGIRTIHIEP